MNQPFFYRDRLKIACDDERLGGTAALVVSQCGLASFEELEEAARKEAADGIPTRYTVAEKRAQELAQIAAAAQGEAIAMRDEIEDAQIELERNQRNLATAENVLEQVQANVADIDGAIAERIAALTEPHFVAQTYTDTHGQSLAIQRGLLDAIATLRLRKEFLPAQLVGAKANVERLRKLVK